MINGKRHISQTDQFRKACSDIRYDTRDLTVKQIVDKSDQFYIPHLCKWPNVRQTSFIESVLLGVQIPLIALMPGYIVGDKTMIWVADGKERINAICKFATGNLRLAEHGLDCLTTLADCTLSDLPHVIQEKFWTAMLRTVFIDEEEGMETASLIRRKLNSGR